MSICVYALAAFFQIQSEQYFFAVGQVADDTAQWKRQFLDQRRRGDDLLVACQLRMLIDICHLQSVTALEMLLANLFEILDRRCRARSHTGYIKMQHVLRTRPTLNRFFEFAHGIVRRVGAHGCSLFGRKSSPTSTRSVFDKSPMILRTGSG